MRKTVVKRHRRRRARRAFIRAWIRSPLTVGAVFPSSRFLARKLAAQIDPHRPGTIIELGAGTGVVTRALLESGVKPDRLVVIERDRRMHHHLIKTFPGVRVLRADAAGLTELLEEQRIHRVNAIVSSLPLLSMPRQVADAIVLQMLAALPPEGTLVQFTYGRGSPLRSAHLKRQHTLGHRSAKVWLNLPPASVWCYRKHAGH